MKCKTCGYTSPDNFAFCPRCGTAIANDSVTKTIRMKCRNCNGEMSFEKGENMLFCPYCGEKELILEDPDITVERIKSETVRTIETEKMKYQEKREKRIMEEKEIKEFKKSKLSLIVLAAFVIMSFMSYRYFKEANYIQGMIAGVQSLLFACSWLTGMKFIRKNHRGLHILFALCGFLLFFLLNMVASNPRFQADMRLNWPTSGIVTELPEPDSRVGKISSNSDRYFSADIYLQDETAYKEYLASCIDAGFVIDADTSSTWYSAYNSEAYELMLNFDSTDGELDITLNAPIKMKELKWPDSEIAMMLPEPKGLYGKIDNDDADSLEIYLGRYSQTMFDEYIDACRTNGFTVRHNRSETDYTAENKDGYSLTLRYLGGNVIKIILSAPKQVVPTTTPDIETETVLPTVDQTVPVTVSPETTAPTVMTTEPSDVSITGIRPEFKSAVDSVEAFMDEYVAFMKKYENNSADEKLLLQYGVVMIKYADAMSKLDKMESDAANDAESAYYLQALTRINAKLLSVAN